MRKRVFSIFAAAALAFGLSACGSSSDAAVPVELVSSVMDANSMTQRQIFVGVVSAGQEASITKDSDRSVTKVYVTAGDTVKKGDRLFTYDAESTQDSLEQKRLELEEQQNTLEEKQDEKKQDEADMAKASASEQLDYTLTIQEVDADIREAQYQIGVKEQEIKRLEEAVKNLDVTAPFDGVVESAGTADVQSESTDSDGDVSTSYDSSGSDSSDAFIRLVEAGNYRVKGSVNEMNIGQISEGMEMTITSRTDSDRTWRGTVSEISTAGGAESKSSDTEYDMMGSDTSGSTSYKTTSSYAFYVKLDALDGLMIGQHVYLSAAEDDTAKGEYVYLPSSFINDPDGSPWVWAEKNGTLEKRSVSLGTYNDKEDLYQVTEGLTKTDYITSPTESLEEGMPCSETKNTGSGDETASTEDAASPASDGESSEADTDGDSADTGFDAGFAGGSLDETLSDEEFSDAADADTSDASDEVAAQVISEENTAEDTAG